MCCYFDFAKAFDRVSTPKLLHILSIIGVTGRLFSCTQSFLSNRTQQIKIGYALSPPLPLRSGVPQGSVLGPVLFILFVNSLTNCLPTISNSKLFADDLKSYVTLTNIDDNMCFQRTIDAICDWSALWQLALWTGKCY